jgi:broad specificity phosphatase PhoE
MIWLARHGATDDNLEPVRVQGHRDIGLNQLGREQAARLADRLAGLELGSLYTSPLLRARQTADIVGERIGLEPVEDPRLMESNRGDWEGRLWQDIAREDPDGYAAWERAGQQFRFPGGESLREQMDRVIAALVDITHGGRLPVVVISHGGSIRTALCHTQQRGLDAFHDWDVPNGALIEL